MTEQQTGIERGQKLLPMRRIVKTWWPLAMSWLLMSLEGPAQSSVVARLANPEINLAAWGGVVFPVALVVESPIVMLLAASTALSKDWGSYLKLRRFMLRASAILTILHVLVAFTPLYYIVAVNLIGAPAEIIEPARTGLMIMLPWTWSIAYRRFNQGVLIRFGHSRAVGFGTVVRLLANGLVLAIGYVIGTVPGIVVASAAIAAGVISEAAYTMVRVRPVLRSQLRLAHSVQPPLDTHSFVKFYVPLAMTTLLSFLVQPIGSAALSRMPRPLESLAAWPVVSGLVFLLTSLGISYSEVVVALLDEPRAERNLARFTAVLAASTTALLLIVATTPIASLWFKGISALPPDLVTLSRRSLWLALPMPAMRALQSWYQGILVNSHRTRGITEAVGAFLLVSSAILWFGVSWGQQTGLYIGQAAFSLATFAQTAWLWYRTRPAVLRSRAQSTDSD